MTLRHLDLPGQLLILLLCVQLTTSSIHSHLRHFETLTSRQIRTRTKRDASTGRVTHKHVHFQALGRRFQLSLTPGWPGMDPNTLETRLVRANGSWENFTVDLSGVYSGVLQHKARTSVTAFLLHGVWTAHIEDDDHVFMVESMRHREPHTGVRKMVVYRTSDVITHNATTGNRPTCLELPRGKPGGHSKRSIPNIWQRSRYDQERSQLDKNENDTERPDGYKHSKIRMTPNYDTDHLPFDTETSLNDTTNDTTPRHVIHKPRYHVEVGLSHGRHKPTHKRPRTFTEHKFCDVRAIVDAEAYHGFFNGSLYWTTYYLMYYHQLVHDIFKKTVFGDYTGLSTRVTGVLIMVEYSDPSIRKYAWNVKKDASFTWDPAGLAEIMDRDKENSRFCLNHMTSIKKVTGSILGAAVTGGICRREHYNAFKNIGYSTMRTVEGDFISEARYITTLAHEIGHSWGTDHDNPDDRICNPSVLSGGKYLMFWQSNQGIHHNNHMFSPCSRKAIGEKIASIGDTCFMPDRVYSRCGNGVLDEGEECDENLAFANESRCCDPNCRLRAGAACDVSSSPCCGRNCQTAPRGQWCHSHEVTECRPKAVCDGERHDVCPAPAAMADNSECGDRGDHAMHRVCLGGRCASLCEVIGTAADPRRLLWPCDCDWSRDSMCHVCCMEPATNTCAPQSGMAYHDGYSCVLGTCHHGYCKSSDYVHVKRVEGVVSRMVVFLVISIVVPGCLMLISGRLIVITAGVLDRLMDLVVTRRYGDVSIGRPRMHVDRLRIQRRSTIGYRPLGHQNKSKNSNHKFGGRASDKKVKTPPNELGSSAKSTAVNSGVLISGVHNSGVHNSGVQSRANTNPTTPSASDKLVERHVRV